MFPTAHKFKSFQLNNQIGQGIIEIVVVLALASILILSLVALSVRSNRSANFSKAEDQAARLSQEGLEFIRNMRDQGPVTVTAIDGSSVGWNYVFDTDFSGNEIAILCSNSCLDFTGTNEVVPGGNRNFDRRVRIRDDLTVLPLNPNPCNTNADPSADVGDWDEIKQFTVEVSWTDTAGPHTSTTNSCLRR